MIAAKQTLVTLDPAKTTPQAPTKATAAAGFPKGMAPTVKGAFPWSSH